MNIGKFSLDSRHVFIIAELCSNVIPHLSALEKCIEQVASTGADSCKIQLFKPSSFPPEEQESKARVTFPRDQVETFVDLCHKHNLLAGASVFDTEAVILCENSNIDFIKLATREWKNRSLIHHSLATGKPVVRSFELNQQIDWDGDFFYHENISLLACVPEYPAEKFTLPYFGSIDRVKGWSSHTSHSLDSLAAVARGARIIEKHISFAPDDYEAGWSLGVDEFRKMVGDIRWLEERL